MSKKVYVDEECIGVFYEALKEYGLVKLLEYREGLTEEITKHDKYHVLEALTAEDMDNAVKYGSSPYTLEQELTLQYDYLLGQLAFYKYEGNESEARNLANEMDGVLEIYDILKSHGVIGDLDLTKPEDITEVTIIE